MKIFFLTRSYLPTIAGGTLIRKAQVDSFERAGFEVIVVVPNYNQKRISIQENIIRIPLSYNLRVAHWLERIGIYEDYLDKWVKRAFKYLKDKIKKDDILFATSGGELGNIKLASSLKEQVGCKFVVNFHDPLDYSLVNGFLLDNAFHISRERQERKYLRNADLIITSANSHRLSLENKLPFLKDKIKNTFFGYVERVEPKEKKISDKLRIVYSGTFSRVQSPELLSKVAQNMEGIEIYFVGNYQEYKPIIPFLQLENSHFIPFLPHDEFLNFMMEKIDVGFVSLASNSLGDGIPSKVYEYINLGLPILGALPTVEHLINQKGYGIVCQYNDLNCLKEAIETLKNKKEYQKFQDNILKDKNFWAMEERIKEVVLWLKNL